jgi:hypothetical protein
MVDSVKDPIEATKDMTFVALDIDFQQVDAAEIDEFVAARNRESGARGCGLALKLERRLSIPSRVGHKGLEAGVIAESDVEEPDATARGIGDRPPIALWIGFERIDDHVRKKEIEGDCCLAVVCSDIHDCDRGRLSKPARLHDRSHVEDHVLQVTEVHGAPETEEAAVKGDFATSGKTCQARHAKRVLCSNQLQLGAQVDLVDAQEVPISTQRWKNPPQGLQLTPTS